METFEIRISNLQKLVQLVVSVWSNYINNEKLNFEKLYFVTSIKKTSSANRDDYQVIDGKCGSENEVSFKKGSPKIFSWKEALTKKQLLLKIDYP